MLIFLDAAHICVDSSVSTIHCIGDYTKIVRIRAVHVPAQLAIPCDSEKPVRV